MAGPNGIQLGYGASDLIGVFGVTPVVRQAAVTTVITTGATTSAPYGFATAAQADAIVAAVNSLITKLQAYGWLT